MDLEYSNLFNETRPEVIGADDRIASLGVQSHDTTFQFNLNDSILGLGFCFCIVSVGLYMSYVYRVSERQEIAEAERIRVEEEKKRIQEMESYRTKIAKAIESYAIHLTNYTLRSRKLEKDDEDRTIASGDDHDDGDTLIEIDSLSSKASAETNDVEKSKQSLNHDDSIQSALGSSAEAKDGFGSPMSHQCNENEVCDASLSSSTSLFITHSSLREAVTNNPCAICLESFRAGDNIVCCSNNIHGQKPHVFHQECSLDYLLAHSEGLNAPCPCCRTLLLPSDEQRQGCLSHSRHSALTLPDLNEGHTSDSAV